MISSLLLKAGASILLLIIAFSALGGIAYQNQHQVPEKVLLGVGAAVIICLILIVAGLLAKIWGF